MYHRRVGLLTVVLVVLSLVFTFAPPGYAQSAPAVTLTPAAAAPGTKVLVQGADFTPGGQAVVVWNGQQGAIVGQGAVDRGGRLTVVIAVPPDAKQGNVAVVVRSTAGPTTEEAAATFAVQGPRVRAAFIHGQDLATANSFKALLDGNGVSTTLMPIGSLGARNAFVGYDVIVVGPDTGSLGNWGTPAAVLALRGSGKPILGVGAGGYAFFGRLGLAIGFRNGVQASRTGLTPVNQRDPLFNTPLQPRLPVGGPATLFTQPVNTIGIFLPQPPIDVYLFGQDQAQYYSLVQQGRRLLWGFDGSPDLMNITGQQLFVNAIYLLFYAKTIDTLVLMHPARMTQLGYAADDVAVLADKVTQLVGLPRGTTNMTALLRDLGTDVPVVISAYSSWNPDSVPSTNALVSAIDGYIESLKKGLYTNLKYVVIVGAHEIIPMKARAADNYEENAWAGGLPSTTGYVYKIYSSTFNGAKGYYLTDSVYSDLSYKNDGWGGDRELVPELSVGRLVETPAQIGDLIDVYIANDATLKRTKRVSVGSIDFKDGAKAAAEAMGAGTDTTLILDGFNSSLVPPKLNATHDVVFIAGHGNYNWITTQAGGQGFMAGATAAQGDTEELGDLSNAVVITDGCHNGINFGDRLYGAYNNSTTFGEFPERFAARKAGIFVGSTGYTWISGSGSSSDPSDAIYSERVASLIMDHLMNGGATTAGRAFQKAINQYASERVALDGADRRAIAITTLYGIPNYRMPKALSFKLPHDFQIFQTSLDPLPPVERIHNRVTLAVHNWRLQSPVTGALLAARLAPAQAPTTGTVLINGASSLGGVNLPSLPVITAQWLVPVISGTISVKFNETQSLSTTIANNVPLPPTGTSDPIGSGFIGTTGSFTATGFFPAQPFFTTTLSNLGDVGTLVTLGIVPVQYNQGTHQTRIWTLLNFDIEISGDAEAATTDADGDTLPDFWEQSYELDPEDASGANGAAGDPDVDGLTNGQEYTGHTDPQRADTDRDGFNDGAEVAAGTDALDPGSFPRTIYLPAIRR